MKTAIITGACLFLCGQPVIATVSAQISIVNTIGTAGPGSSITMQFAVTNTGDVSRNFGVGAEIEQNSAAIAQIGQQKTATISPNSSYTATFNYQIPWWSNGIYTAHAVVWSGTPGSSTWLNDAAQNFTISTPAAASTGRIAYEVYNAYLSVPENSDDGNIFICTLPAGQRVNMTGRFGLKNAMNPQFSPDGSKMVFMAIPSNATRTYDSLEIFVYDLAVDELSQLTVNDVPDEDPGFSPDGQSIVFKESGQIWTMLLDGSNPKQLTHTSDEKSGPNYSPDGTQIVYWSGSGANETIWRMLSDGTSPSQLVAGSGLEEFYPRYRDSQNVLYARWESASDSHGQVFNYSIASGLSQQFPTNAIDVMQADNEDAFAVNASLIGFSSDRPYGMGGYDIYLGDTTSGVIYQLPNLNTTNGELGGFYSPYTHAREIVLDNPAAGSSFVAGSTILLTATAWSDGGIWTAASPNVMFVQGQNTNEFTGLHDNGLNGDAVAGDGIYSSIITLPMTAGNFTVYASATSSDGGVSNNIQSSSIQATLIAATGSLQVTISPAGAVNAGAQWRVDGGAWQNSGATVGGLPAGSHTVGFSTLTGWENPANQTVSVTNNQTTSVTGVYVKPHAATATSVLAGDIVAGANITDGGYGYTNTPIVQFVGGGGSGAQAVAVVSNGVVTGIIVTNGGYGYTNAPLVVIAPPFVQILSMVLTNTPAAAAAPIITNGSILGAKITASGMGYTTPPAVTFSDSSGSGAAAYAQVGNGGVTNIVITSAGSCYSSNTVINILPAGYENSVISSANNLIMGQNYQLQMSADLNTWTNSGSVFMATNSIMTYPQYFIVSNWSQLYLRLQTAP